MNSPFKQLPAPNWGQFRSGSSSHIPSAYIGIHSPILLEKIKWSPALEEV